MDSDQLAKVLRQHKLWVGNNGGSRANLRAANLRAADLRDANLRGANLRDANLRAADLRDADLRAADLRDADLRDADLRDADLRDADLRAADLRDADLRDADLSDADLSRCTGLLDPVSWLAEFPSDDDGIIVYRSQTGERSKPANWKVAPGEYLTEVVNPDRCTAHACGVSFGRLEWVKSNYPGIIWRCRIEWRDLAGVVVPYNTEGKARCSRLRLLEVVNPQP